MIRGSSEVKKVLDQIDDPDVRVYVVWVPSLAADKEDRVPAAAGRIADARASHYWDGEGKLKLTYQRVMKMDRPAWDVYFAYGRDAEWKADPPSPDYWQHQLRGLPPEQMLDSGKLAGEMLKMLSQKR